jgi:hypothetical protein
MVVATEPVYGMLTTGVPVTAKLVMVVAVNRVPPKPVQVMLPVPKAIVLALELLDENEAQFN